MFRIKHLKRALLAACAVAWFAPTYAAAPDSDTKEVQSYVLTDAALAKYTKATKNLAALPAGALGSCDDDDSESTSLSDAVAKLDAMPGAKNAIQSAGMTTREYLLFSFSLLHNGLAAWSVSQPGGKLPPGTSKANVDFYNKHQAELKQLKVLEKGDECEAEEEEEEGEDRE